MGKRSGRIQYKRRYTNCQLAYEETLITIIHQGAAYPLEQLRSKTEDVKCWQDGSSIFPGNIKWYNHSGRQFGNFF